MVRKKERRGGDKKKKREEDNIRKRSGSRITLGRVGQEERRTINHAERKFPWKEREGDEVATEAEKLGVEGEGGWSLPGGPWPALI
jgi:hypothetical protein